MYSGLGTEPVSPTRLELFRKQGFGDKSLLVFQALHALRPKPAKPLRTQFRREQIRKPLVESRSLLISASVRLFLTS